MDFFIGNRDITVISYAIRNASEAVEQVKSRESISVKIQTLIYSSDSEEIEKLILYGFLSIVQENKVDLTLGGHVLFNSLTFMQFDFNENDEVLKFKLVHNMQAARSQISHDIRIIMKQEPIYDERKMRLEEHISSELSKKNIEYIAATKTYKRKNDNNSPMTNKIMKENDFLLELNYNEIMYRGESPNWVVWDNLERTNSNDETTTGLVKDYRSGKAVRVKTNTIKTIACRLCSNVMTFRKVEKHSSELKGYIFFICERLITNLPFKICGYNEYLLSPYEGM